MNSFWANFGMKLKKHSMYFSKLHNYPGQLFLELGLQESVSQTKPLHHTVQFLFLCKVVDEEITPGVKTIYSPCIYHLSSLPFLD